MARVTLKTIAEEVGVSRMTVSNAFSRPDQLSAELRDRILATAERLGYGGPDATARALARGRSGVVGLLLTDSPHEAFANEVTTGLVAAVTRELAPSGLAIALLSPAAEGQAVDPARELPMDGAIVYACTDRSPSIDGLLRRGLPLVFVDREGREGDAEVLVDDVAGARAGAEHLLELGHRRLAVLLDAGPPPGPVEGDPRRLVSGVVARQRLDGWLDAIEAAGAAATALTVPWEDEGAALELLRELLRRDPRPTGVLCMSDTIGELVLRAAALEDLDVPGELSVVGYDDAPVAHRTRPPLTTVRQDLDAKGRAAAHALLAQLGDAGAPPERVVLPTALVVRESTGPAPSAG